MTNPTPFYFADVAGAGTGRTSSMRAPDELDALALAPLGEQIADYVRGVLPPGMDFAVFIAAPDPSRPATAKATRVIAVSSHRDRMVRHVAAWVVETLEHLKGKGRGESTRRELVIDTERNTTVKVPWEKVPK